MQAHARRQPHRGQDRVFRQAFDARQHGAGVVGSSRKRRDDSATGPTLNEPTTPILDDFNRVPDELPVSQGGNWAPTGIMGNAGAKLENQALIKNPNAQDSSSYRQAEYSGDVEAYYTIAGPPSSSNGQYLYIGLQDAGTPAFEGYGAVLEQQPSGSRLHLRRYDNGVATQLGITDWFGGVDSGDKLLLRRVGTTIEAWLRDNGVWTLRLSQVNQTLYAGPGKIGVRFFRNVGTPGVMDDFGGGSIGAPPPTTRLTVIKTIVNDNGGNAVPSSWTMNVAGPTPLSFPGAGSPGTTNDVQPGAYRVTESGGPADYSLTYSGDCDSDGDVTLALGQTKTCILTNDDQAASGGPPPGQTFGSGEDGTGVHGNCGCGLFADPVSSRTGAFTTSVADLDLPGTGVPFGWSRSYTSADATVGRLGPGWTDSYSASLAIQPNGDVRLHGEDGQQILYVEQPNGSFVGAPGSLSTLASVAGGYELLRTDQVRYRFDAEGRLLSIKDRNDQGVTLGYDGQNRLTTVTDAANRQATVSYNASNLVSQVQTSDGRSVGYGYTSGRLTSVTDVRGKTWTYAYDAGGRLEKITDPLSHAQVTNVYGADGRVRSQTDALGKQTTFAWNAGHGDGDCHRREPEDVDARLRRGRARRGGRSLGERHPPRPRRRPERDLGHRADERASADDLRRGGEHADRDGARLARKRHEDLRLQRTKRRRARHRRSRQGHRLRLQRGHGEPDLGHPGRRRGRLLHLRRRRPGRDLHRRQREDLDVRLLPGDGLPPVLDRPARQQDDLHLRRRRPRRDPGRSQGQRLGLQLRGRLHLDATPTTRQDSS